MNTQSTPPPLVGFNNNVRYRGMRFHIQTEDSGVARPHIITHLFADGGHVIKSLRTDYSEYVDHPDRPALVQRMMREQHRAMAIDLRDGRLDDKIDDLRRAQSEEPDTDAEQETVRSVPPPASGSDNPASTAQPSSSQVTADVNGRSPAGAPEAERRGRASGRARRPSRPPEAGKKRRSGTPKGGRASPRSLGRPSAALETKPSSASIFGAEPQESLDDVILSYVSHAKNGPPTRGHK